MPLKLLGNGGLCHLLFQDPPIWEVLVKDMLECCVVRPLDEVSKLVCHHILYAFNGQLYQFQVEE